MDKRNVVRQVGILLAVIGIGIRLLLPYPAAVYFIFPLGAGIAALLELMRSRVLGAVLLVLSFPALFILSVGPYEIDGVRTLLLSPVAPIGTPVAFIGGLLFTRRYLGTLRPE